MKTKSLLTISLLLIGGSAFAMGKDPITTALHCTMELPDDGSGVAKNAIVDINGATPTRETKSLLLTQPDMDPKAPAHVVTIGKGDPNATVVGTSTIIANQVNDIKQTKLLVIDPAITDSADGTPAENINIVFKIKVGYQLDAKTKKASYSGSLFYSLQDPAIKDTTKSLVQGGGAVTCTCLNPDKATAVDCALIDENADDKPTSPAKN
jgi:hypothetical protein